MHTILHLDYFHLTYDKILPFRLERTSSFLITSVLHSAMWITLTRQSDIDRHWNYFQSFAITNNAAMNNLLYTSLCVGTSIWLNKLPKVELLD